MDTLRDTILHNHCSQNTVQNEEALVSLSTSVPYSVYNMDTDYEMELFFERQQYVHPTFKELLEIFPEAKPIAKREVKKQIVRLKTILANQSASKNAYLESILKNEKPRFHMAIIEGVDKAFDAQNKRYERELKQLTFRLLTLEGKETKGALNIEKAKMVPIDSLITIGRDHKAKCVWHNERTGSMHVYGNKTVHCFGCGKRGDVIDVYRALHQVDFKTAVMALQSL